MTLLFVAHLLHQSAKLIDASHGRPMILISSAFGAVGTASVVGSPFTNAAMRRLIYRIKPISLHSEMREMRDSNAIDLQHSAKRRLQRPSVSSPLPGSEQKCQMNRNSCRLSRWLWPRQVQRAQLYSNRHPALAALQKTNFNVVAYLTDSMDKDFVLLTEELDAHL